MERVRRLLATKGFDAVEEEIFCSIYDERDERVLFHKLRSRNKSEIIANFLPSHEYFLKWGHGVASEETSENEKKGGDVSSSDEDEEMEEGDKKSDDDHGLVREEGIVDWLTIEEITKTKAAFGEYNIAAIAAFKKMFPSIELL